MIRSTFGLIDKMRIEVFADKSYRGSPRKTIFVQLNPEKYTIRHNVVFCEGQAIGTSGSDIRFNKIEPREDNFEFWFDSSGVVPPGKIKEGGGALTDSLGDAAESLQPALYNPLAETATVEKEVEEFKRLLMSYDGDTHQTSYLKLLWGGYSMECRLKSMDIEYSLFRRDGRPVRAKVKCAFIGTVDYKVMVAQENKSSPDLTHVRKVRMNEKITLLTEEIYKTDQYYIDVAGSNKLLTFRNLEIGRELRFPPVK